MYVESAGDFNHGAVGALQTVSLLPIPQRAAATVTFELTTLDGAPSGTTASVDSR